MTFPAVDYNKTRTTMVVGLRNLEDQAVWNRFFNSYWKLIYHSARSSGLEDADAQEVVQETVIAVTKNIGNLEYDRSKGSFKGWLMKTTKWDDTFSILYFNYASNNPHEAYVLSNLESDKSKIYLYDLAKDQVTKELFSNTNYDVSGMDISRNRNWELDYFSYEGEKYEIVPVSKYYKKLHAKLQKEFSKT